MKDLLKRSREICSNVAAPQNFTWHDSQSWGMFRRRFCRRRARRSEEETQNLFTPWNPLISQASCDSNRSLHNEGCAPFMDSLRYLRGYSRGTIVEQERNARGVPVEDCPVQRLPFYVKGRVCILVRIGATQQARIGATQQARIGATQQARIGATQQARIGAAQHLKGSVRTRQRERESACV